MSIPLITQHVLEIDERCEFPLYTDELVCLQHQGNPAWIQSAVVLRGGDSMFPLVSSSQLATPKDWKVRCKL